MESEPVAAVWEGAPAHAAAGNDAALDLEFITDAAALQALEKPWNELLEQCGECCPFLRHEWVAAWWRCFGQGGELHVVLAWKGRRLVGVAPHMLSRERRYGLSIRRLGTLYNPHVQRAEFAAEPAEREAFHQALWRSLAALTPAWDVLELCQFHADSATLEGMARQAEAAGLPFGYWEEGRSPCLPIAGNWEDYVASLSANRRSQIKRKLKKLGEAGEVRLETVAAGDALDGALLEGFAIEAMGWKGSGGTAILSAADMREFYQELAGRLADHDGLRLYFLVAGGRRIAFQYCLRSGNRLFLLKLGYDPDFAAHSPSELLCWLVLRQAFEDGVKEYDFLGDSDPWKLKWATSDRRHVWLYVMAPTWRGKLLALLKLRLVPALKAWRKRWAGGRPPVSAGSP